MCLTRLVGRPAAGRLQARGEVVYPQVHLHRTLIPRTRELLHERGGQPRETKRNRFRLSPHISVRRIVRDRCLSVRSWPRTFSMGPLRTVAVALSFSNSTLATAMLTLGYRLEAADGNLLV